ncbi:urease subunit beta [Streptacidiphilus pinicola]|uniref:Urease subunit beta n=1 Tax=Streptacidiphilus pinicola TaxID=2219663 RepID=A0A2X0IM14_9ACTN|nr:urease subunit beta [Streptacidiphilus pinicola]RAG86154.1 urease subunit beta [Streptacidiphilus pinicola]
MSAGRPAYLYGEAPVEINAGRATARVRVSNTGDRAIQVGSHYHFFEANRALDFERAQAYGMHLDLPAGTGVRFEPGDTRDVDLVAFAGHRRLVGFSGLVDGGLNAADTRAKALRRAAELGFLGARPGSDVVGEAVGATLAFDKDAKGGDA